MAVRRTRTGRAKKWHPTQRYAAELTCIGWPAGLKAVAVREARARTGWLGTAGHGWAAPAVPVSHNLQLRLVSSSAGFILFIPYWTGRCQLAGRPAATRCLSLSLAGLRAGVVVRTADATLPAALAADLLISPSGLRAAWGRVAVPLGVMGRSSTGSVVDSAPPCF